MFELVLRGQVWRYEVGVRAGLGEFAGRWRMGWSTELWALKIELLHNSVV